ncbi:copper homeostasis protein cutC homolog [Mizuhopecten yessoensis]|uniref:Copper homeostasis protein cutC homolog n=1 Tax=Mizuhopecten yessoensis TaxID=6573 RepID=A0A210Q396_MIZYE|nr:copper homeostasis protein cutC homolog [Mizuhopecten yessoensis]OWF43185.1 Copper homeostasis protein cutC-like [Mizuhopecten yessoensis]
MELCVDSVESALNAEEGGATRVELCGSLVEGGTTPSLGLFRIVKSRLSIPVFVIIRPRGGDFLYSDAEVGVMKEDISLFTSSPDRPDGFVIGCLNVDGTVNTVLCKEFIALARPSKMTFHRAIDMTPDLGDALEAVIGCGFDRVLTSGGQSTALEGLPVLSDLVIQAKGRVVIMPGGGITDHNVARIVQGCGCTEFHCSARSSRSSLMTYQKQGVAIGASLSPPEFSLKAADVCKIRTILLTAKSGIN